MRFDITLFSADHADAVRECGDIALNLLFVHFVVYPKGTTVTERTIPYSDAYVRTWSMPNLFTGKPGYQLSCVEYPIPLWGKVAMAFLIGFSISTALYTAFSFI
jgi:hypothetical protein